MSELARRGGWRKAEVQRKLRRTAAQVLADDIQASLDPFVQRIQAARDAGDLVGALAVVREAMGVSEETATRAEMAQAMRDRRANARATGERWRRDDDYDEEF